MKDMQKRSFRYRILVMTAIIGALLVISGCALLQRDEPQIRNWQPVISPDGTRIAFASPVEENGFELFIYTPATGEKTRLTRNTIDDWAPSWSPEGERLVFVSNKDDNLDLYIIDIATGATFRLTSHDKEDANPHWGTDGRIAFNSKRSGEWEAYTIDANGANLRLIIAVAVD
ncbi:TPA: hypothetical protein DD712_02555 [Candidatus Acetothermia bacterium]|nr:hypothetical protein [Candidatus Acetothermia bacterium]